MDGDVERGVLRDMKEYEIDPVLWNYGHGGLFSG